MRKHELLGTTTNSRIYLLLRVALTKETYTKRSPRHPHNRPKPDRSWKAHRQRQYHDS
jgi:hypothetical protein